MSRTIILEEADRKELVDLYRTAQTTPVIGFSVRDMIEGRDWASLAWNSVRRKMDELGEKYGYDPRKHVIDPETGKIEIYDNPEESIINGGERK